MDKLVHDDQALLLRFAQGESLTKREVNVWSKWPYAPYSSRNGLDGHQRIIMNIYFTMDDSNFAHCTHCTIHWPRVVFWLVIFLILVSTLAVVLETLETLQSKQWQ